MYQFPFEAVQALDIRPLPIIQNSARIDENVSMMVFNDSITLRRDVARNLNPPKPGIFVPLGANYAGVEGDLVV
jgi:hypothetical protein